ncbi:hypothetical protein [Streptomyces sp. NPDC004267]|uniref:hypothetical protein n=1 Tax=Streptomyces sp. NPDC004267 TaxID=3364694 RepID=UPI0036A56C6D
MIPSDIRLTLIDRATDEVEAETISADTLTAFVRHLRSPELDVCNWYRCNDFALSAGVKPYQARTAVGQLVRAALLERDVVPRRRGGQDARYTVYRLAPLDVQEGAGQ